MSAFYVPMKMGHESILTLVVMYVVQGFGNFFEHLAFYSQMIQFTPSSITIYRMCVYVTEHDVHLHMYTYMHNITTYC